MAKLKLTTRVVEGCAPRTQAASNRLFYLAAARRTYGEFARGE